VGGAIAEELAEGLLVVRDRVSFDEGDEVARGVAGECGLGEVGVGGEIVIGRGVEVGEVAAASAGDEDFLAGAVGLFEDESATAAASGFDGAHQARGACSEDEDVDFGEGIHSWGGRLILQRIGEHMIPKNRVGEGER
jgi:hypothetical protein